MLNVLVVANYFIYKVYEILYWLIEMNGYGCWVLFYDREIFLNFEVRIYRYYHLLY
jgi:hypothetical protein